MSDGFEVKTNQDKQVIVVLHPDCKISKAEILALLREAGIDVETVVFLTPKDSSSCSEIGDTPVIIPLDASVSDQPELVSTAQHCSNCGGRVIVVFGSDFTHKGLHQIADKFGTQCGWSSSDLSAQITGLETDVPLSSTGDEVTRPRANEVKCR